MPVFILKNGGETLTGSSGNDTITGGTGNDRILSGDGADLIDGGDGNDQINGYPTTGSAYSFWTYSGAKTINGGNGDDFIYGADGADSISGGNGNDTVYGSVGNDSIEGSLGDDFLSGGSGNDSISGGLGNDSLYDGDGSDYVEGGDGDDYFSSQSGGGDTLLGGSGNDDFNAYTGTGNKYIDGESGNDKLYGGSGNDSLIGGTGEDTINGSSGNDSVTGGIGNDNLSGDEDNDTLVGGTGNDTLYGGDGNDSLLGGEGNDLLLDQSNGQDTLFGGDGDDKLNVYTGTGNKYLDGGLGADTLYGGTGSDTLNGGDGNDYIDGNESNDSLMGGAGNDTLNGGVGNDTLEGGDGDDLRLQGYAGKDSIAGGSGNDKLWGDEGNDTLDGGTGNDSLIGGDGEDSLVGGDGNDTISGSAGNDLIQGGAGDDTINKLDDSGNDIVYGGDGNDYVNFTTVTGNKLIYGESGNDSLDGGTGNDTLDGGIGNDSIEGNLGNDSIIGGEGNDTIYGVDGNDTIYSGLGDDKVYGGNGNDVLDGGDGVDSLYGGDGNDTYYIDSTFDYIYDSSGTDTAYVSTSFVKIPSSIENVIYTNGAQALPYWISALLYDDTAGKRFTTLLGDSKTFGYNFPSTLPSYETSAKDANGFTPFTSTQQNRTTEAFIYIASLLDLKFNEVSDPAAKNTFTFASNIQINSGGYANRPSSSFEGSDIYLNDKNYNATLADGTSGAVILIHEIGHALGLKHPFDHEQAGEGGIAEAPYLTGSEENGIWTVMSYEKTKAQYQIQYSPLDIAALQYLYGPSKTARTGNDTYRISPTEPNFVWDGAGLDVIDAASVTQAATIYLTPGYQGFLGTTKAEKITTAGQITVNFGSVIENLIGSNYDDQLYGNEIGNKIEGGTGSDSIEGWDGDDILLGGGGNDYLSGGSGNDSIEGGDGNDTLVFNGLATNYTIRYDSSTQNYSIEAKSGIEGKDTFKTTEFLKFSDKTIALQSIDLTPPTIAISSNLTSIGIGKTSTISFTISESVSDFVLGDVAVTGGTLSNFTGGSTAYAATFSPALNFAGVASIRVTSSKFTDSAGNTNEDGAEANNNLSIEIDTLAPFITTYSPENSATKVGVASDIVLTFSEKIQKDTGNIVLKTSAGLTTATYEVAFSNNLTLTDTTLTINPTANLSFDTSYKIEIASGAFKDLFGNDLAGTSTYNFTTVSSIIGAAAGEILNGTASEDNILGYAGNDTITGGFGSDVIDGGTGIDTVKFSGQFGSGSLANYSIQKLINGSWTVSYIGPIIAIFPPPPTDGIDTLTFVERIQFTDRSFALDLDGNAGNTAKIIGAVLGKAALRNPTYVGIGLSYLDKGMSYSDLGALALNAVGAATNDAIVSTLWLNVIGSPASALDKAPFIKMLADGMKAGDLVALAADTALNTSNINLVGLAQSGIEYIPV
jgi:Ca2+-binding RTX toxin-like protein